MKVAILGTTGYTGLVLLRLLLNHPKVDEIIPVSSSSVGDKIYEHDNGISPVELKKKVPMETLVSVQDAINAKPDVVFAALPHLKSAEISKDFFGKSVIIDLSADFRIEDNELFKKAYGEEHPDPVLQKEAVYGLCEWYRDKISNAKLIANPGCYPTASLLPLMPLVKEGIISGNIVINALSGISGAGRSAKPNSLFVKRSENANAYNVGTKHRHQIEIQKELDFALNGELDKALFNPHLIPIRRGMVVTTVASLKEKTDDSTIREIYSRYYKNDSFINILENGIPETANCLGSNRCDISWQIEGDKIILMSVIDNLLKGASGQAVQNMNIRFGFEETLGLPINGEF